MAIILGYILLIVVQNFFDILHFIPILFSHLVDDITKDNGVLHLLGFLVTFGALVMSYKSFKRSEKQAKFTELRAAAETIAQAENYIKVNEAYLKDNKITYGAHLDIKGALTLLHKNGRVFPYLQLPHAFLRSADLQGAKLGAANLQGTELWFANLQGADLRMADLTDVENLTREQIFSAKWTNDYGWSVPPTLPEYITHPDGVEDEDIARWLATPSKE